MGFDSGVQWLVGVAGPRCGEAGRGEGLSLALPPYFSRFICLINSLFPVSIKEEVVCSSICKYT